MEKAVIEFAKPSVGEEEIGAVAEVLRSGWISQGAKVEEFEEAVASYVGAKYAVAVHSGTAALHLALHLSGVGHGDEVICPVFTCIATANAVRQAGAWPVFVDVQRDTFNIEPDLIERAIARRTKAIVVVHQFGLPADMSSILPLAKWHNLAAIEDAACALGSEYEGRKVGSLGSPTCFSFHPRKVITTGEGGMVVTDDLGYAARARAFRSHGDATSVLARHQAKGLLDSEYPAWGFNYRMTDIQAALGATQMQRLKALLARRRRIAAIYDRGLAEIPCLVSPVVSAFATHSYQSYLVRLKRSKVTRDEIVAGLVEKNIACRRAPRSLHQEKCYESACSDQAFPNSSLVADHSFFLPIHGELSDEEAQYVVESLKELLL